MKRLFFVCALLAAPFLIRTNATAAQDLKIYGQETPPFNYTLDGKYTGITTAIVEEIRNALGVTTEIEVVPTARAMDYVAHNPNVMVLSFSKTPEREKAGFHFVGPVATIGHALWKKRGAAISVGSLADVKSQNLSVGCVLGDWRSKFLKDAGVTVSEVPTTELSLKKLLADHLPLMVASDFELPVVAKIAGVGVPEVEPVFTIGESSPYLMFSKDTDQATLDKWTNAYAALERTDFLNKLAEKWESDLGHSAQVRSGKRLVHPSIAFEATSVDVGVIP